MSLRRSPWVIALSTATAILAAACTGTGSQGSTTPPGGGIGTGGGSGTGGAGGIEQGGAQTSVPLGIKPDKANVPYCSLGGVPQDQQDMDIYQPKGSGGGPTPAIIYLHGGGWIVGDKAKERPNPTTGRPVVSDWITALQDKGMLVAAINYALAPRSPFPLAIEDVKCAIRYLRAKASTYNIDPNKIGAVGGSAGGHLVALLAVTNDSRMWDVGPYLNESSKVQAVVDLFGPTDIALLAQERGINRILQLIFGPESDWPKYSPVTYVSAGAAPTLIMNGEQDPGVPPQQAQELYDKLHAAGATTQLVLVKNAGHGFVPMPSNATISPSLGQIKDDIVNWFAKYLLGTG